MFKINKNILFVSGVVMAIILIIAASFVFKNKTPAEISTPTNTENSQNTPTENSNSPTDVSDQNTITREVPQYSGRPISEVRYGAGFSVPPSAITQKTKDLNVLKTALEKDPFNINDWIAVGIIKKFFNDFEGAKDAWVYVTVLYPSDPLSFENLGNLYALYLHDNAKAEYYYKKALENNPIEPSFYIALADFYRNFTKEKSKVSATILSGLERIEDVNLFLYLGSFYRDEGDKTNA